MALFLTFFVFVLFLLSFSSAYVPEPFACQAHTKLQEEERRAQKYLETRKGCMSVQQLMDACVKVLVADHKDTIIEECYKLISDNEVESEFQTR